MTTYFSVDVETTGLNPFRADHQLLSVGAWSIDERGLLLDSWYERITGDDTWDPGTREWWERQNTEAKFEVFRTTGEIPAIAAEAFVSWVKDHDDPCVFVANPATFDHAWILRWLTYTGFAMPFDYRTLCLRSAAWGRDGGPWGLDRTGHQPRIPHHALHDAQAQAFDLIDLLPVAEAEVSA